MSPDSPHPSYDGLTKRFKQHSALDGVQGLLGWDAKVTMPKGSGVLRGEHSAAVAEAMHGLLIDPATADLLAGATEELIGVDDPWKQADLQAMRHAHVHASAVPADLVGALELAKEACSGQWHKARPNDDFDGYRPSQQALLDLQREAASVLGEALECSPYDAMIDAFDPGMTSADIKRIFDQVEGFLPTLIREIQDNQAGQARLHRPEGPFPIEKQRDLCEKLIRALGVDPSRSRFDVSVHPFTVSLGGADDVRITTRFDEKNFLSGVTGTTHEVGHMLYEMGMPREWHGHKVGQVPGMTAHEAMSLFLERIVGKTPEFSTFLAKQARETLGGNADSEAWQADNIQALLREVKPSLIRVEADEVTYGAHIMLRFEIERMLFANEIQVADLPDIWRTKMKALLGVEVPNDKEGCMQDIHWPSGAFGYFPSYFLGAMSAVQHFEQMGKDNPDALTAVEHGDFTKVFAWLKDNVYAKAGLHNAQGLVESVTGSTIDPSKLEAHFRRRYLGKQ